MAATGLAGGAAFTGGFATGFTDAAFAGLATTGLATGFVGAVLAAGLATGFTAAAFFAGLAGAFFTAELDLDAALGLATEAAFLATGFFAGDLAGADFAATFADFALAAGAFAFAAGPFALTAGLAADFPGLAFVLFVKAVSPDLLKAWEI